MYQFTVSEGATVGTSVGRVIATDADMGENTDMGYLISDQEGGELFKVTTDADTQEAVICIKKVRHRLAPGWMKSQRISPSAYHCHLFPNLTATKVLEHQNRWMFPPTFKEKVIKNLKWPKLIFV